MFCTTFIQADLAQMYIKAGLKSVGTVFLLTDAQIPDETFLVLINDLLASGEIPDLFAGDEYESIIAGVRNEVKMSGLQDTRENCWSFFIDRVRKQLKVVLCFSPVGATLRVRSRKFPAIVNCTSIDWFHAWPDEALMSVSTRFLSEVELIPVSLFYTYHLVNSTHLHHVSKVTTVQHEVSNFVEWPLKRISYLVK